MKTRSAFLVAIAVLLLLGTVALAQSGGPVPPIWYTVEQGAVSGGVYRLTVLSWQVEGSASGGEYQLLSPTSPTLRGNGCCCTYLPCVLRSLQ